VLATLVAIASRQASIQQYYIMHKTCKDAEWRLCANTQPMPRMDGNSVYSSMLPRLQHSACGTLLYRDIASVAAPETRGANGDDAMA
jgi:hypothetical protein